MDNVLRLPQLASQVADGHLLLLQGCKVLLRVGRLDAVAVPARVVSCGARPSVGGEKVTRQLPLPVLLWVRHHPSLALEKPPSRAASKRFRPNRKRAVCISLRCSGAKRLEVCWVCSTPYYSGGGKELG